MTYNERIYTSFVTLCLFLWQILDPTSVIDIQAGLDAGALSNQKIPKNVEKHIRSYDGQIDKPK